MNYPSLRELFSAFILFILTVTLVFASRYSRLYSSDAVVAEQKTVLLIENRLETDDLTQAFDSLGVRYNPEELHWAASVLGWKRYRAGRYVITGGVSYEDLLSRMAKGIQDPVRVVVHSGIDIPRFSERLSNQMQADSLSFSAQFTDSSSVAVQAGISGGQLFGRMLPNTYQFYWTSPAEQTVRRIYNEFERQVTEPFSEEIDASPFTLNEIITLASIVEWEARLPEEKPRISGLYINRLNRNMLLQADPTVLYALGERRRLLFEDYRYDHPYNTYLNPGLPPGPISNPDKASIRAVLEPEEHEYLFMVAKPDGSHEFNRTFEEHKRSSENWRSWLREQYRIKREMEEKGALPGN